MNTDFKINHLLLAKVLGSVYLFSVPISGYLGWLGYSFGYHVFKISFFLNILLFAYFIFKSSLSCLSLISVVFFFLLLSMADSIVNLEDILFGPFFSHLLFFVVIVVGLGSASATYKTLWRDVSQFDSYFKANIWFLFLFFVFYFYSFRSGLIPYWGMSSALPLVLPFFLLRKSWFYVLLTLLVCVLSGKRSIIIIAIIQLLFFYFFMLKAPFLKRSGMIIVFLILCFGLTLAFPDIFARFKGFSFDGGPLDYSALTSGRFDEMVVFFEKFSGDMLGAVLGFGLGANVLVDYSFGSSRTLHYSHFSPFGIILVGGFLFAVFIYLTFIVNLYLAFRLFLKTRSDLLAYLVLCGIYFFITSLSGPALFNDVLFWLVLGLLVFCNFNRTFAYHLSASVIGNRRISES
ncbi:MAG: hypothetical protein VX787_13525 [Pseudomonadota bacterium]|nr:hypothetical protein [Pseudomonadota bacterium]